MQQHVIQLIPACNFIKNQKHFAKYKKHTRVQPKDSNKTVSTENAYPYLQHPPDFRQKSILHKSLL